MNVQQLESKTSESLLGIPVVVIIEKDEGEEIYTELVVEQVEIDSKTVFAIKVKR